MVKENHYRNKFANNWWSRSPFLIYLPLKVSCFLYYVILRADNSKPTIQTSHFISNYSLPFYFQSLCKAYNNIIRHIFCFNDKTYSNVILKKGHKWKKKVFQYLIKYVAYNFSIFCTLSGNEVLCN
jgi:hypothetical protein